MPGGDFLTALELVAPPPEGVTPLAAEGWDRFIAENGFVPPADYRAMFDRYGAGGFGYYESTGAWLTMLHPVGPGTTFVEQSAWQRSVNTAGAGVTVCSYGRMRLGADDPIHWEIAMDFPPALEEVAKALVVRLAHELGVGVRECRNLEYDLVWDDVVRRTAQDR